MNIFTLSLDPTECARMHCDKHVIKMVTEYAQLLATAHRVLDGVPTKVLSPGGMRRTEYILLDDEQDSNMMKATHINHPCAVWARSSSDAFHELNMLLFALAKEYTFRYGKTHAAFERHINSRAHFIPLNIRLGHAPERPQTMPPQYQVKGDPVSAYRAFYNGDKASFATWKGKVAGREAPDWFTTKEFTS